MRTLLIAIARLVVALPGMKSAVTASSPPSGT